MVKQSQLARGKKWTEIQKQSEFKQDTKSLDWLKTQVSIVEDIEAYTNSIKTKPKAKE